MQDKNSHLLANLSDVFLFVTVYHNNANWFVKVQVKFLGEIRLLKGSQAFLVELCFSYAKMINMNIQNSAELIPILRERLEPVELADILSDALEGQRPNARKAAVLLGLFDQDDETHLIFIRRASTLRSHSGEIAFPGGSIDPADSSPVMAALREAQEEIGLDPTRVEVLGILPPVFTVVSNFLITPVVAFLPQGLGTLQLEASEVAELILIPLRGLADPAIAHTEEWTRGGLTRTIYFFDHGPYRIWGATARILNMLLEILAT
jgi:8-oxo-dGTP pyrophosphatase MutT (NUDIX family)